MVSVVEFGAFQERPMGSMRLQHCDLRTMGSGSGSGSGFTPASFRAASKPSCWWLCTRRSCRPGSTEALSAAGRQAGRQAAAAPGLAPRQQLAQQARLWETSPSGRRDTCRRRRGREEGGGGGVGADRGRREFFCRETD